ncbi:MAG: hypothetical protein WD049_07295 [Candidatus Paceibacterota bacterium]
MPEETLTDLSNRYGSDKGTVGPSPQWGAHNFTDIYEAYLERYRFSGVAILEVGLGVVGDNWDALIVHGQNAGGASLKMWHEFFPSGRIFGIDVNPCSYLDNERTKTFVVDQSSIRDLEAFTEATKGVAFDIIIDDGSHRPDHQQISLSYLFKHLKRGGLYFIEDLASNGRGDGAQGRHACDAVRNTRSVLKHYRKHGQFLEPNALPHLWESGEVRPTHRRREDQPRYWRTRKDPFAGVWSEILLWLQDEPDASAKLLFERLRKKHPEHDFPPGQLRTLQRRIRQWRQTYSDLEPHWFASLNL